MADIIGFPLDDTLSDASDMGVWNGGYTSGVYPKEGSLVGTAIGGRDVRLSPGLLNLKRDEFRSVAALVPVAKVITIDPGASSLPRYDVVSLRYDKNIEGLEVLYKKGTPSQKPQIPAISRNTVDTDELYPFAVYVRAGATQITQADIVDLRLNETYCGYVRDNVARIPTQALYDSWWSWFTALKLDAETQAQQFVDWLNAFKTTKDAEFAAWYASKQGEVNAWFTALKNTTTSQVDAMFLDFETQLADVIASIGALSDDPALQLQLQINDIKAKKVVSDSGAFGWRVDKQTGALYADFSGIWVKVDGAFINIALTAQEYDARGYTAAAYDALNLTADEYFYKLRTL